jgi:hypothetical protein
VDERLVRELKTYQEQAMGELEEKARQDAALHAEIADLKRRIDHATQLLRLEGGQPEAGDQMDATAPIRLPTASATQAGSVLADAAHDVLTEENRPMHYRELTRALQTRGIVIGGREPTNNVIAAMTRDERFYRPARGTYFLRALAKGPIRHVGVRHQRRGA